MNQITNKSKAYLLALLAVLFWSTMSSAFKLTLQVTSKDVLLFWAIFFGLAALILINLLGKNKLNFKALTLREWLSSALMGLLNPFLYYIILFEAYNLLEAQIAGTLNYVWPIALVLLSIPLLKQKINFISILAIFISFFGLIVISLQGNYESLQFANPLGVSLAIGSSLFWALYWIINMKDKREETGKIMLNLMFGFIFIFVYTLITHGTIAFPSGNAWFGVIYIGLFEMSITFVIWLKALQYSENTAKVSNLIYLSPFIALFIIHITIGERIYLSTIIGLVFIISGIVLQQFSKRATLK